MSNATIRFSDRVSFSADVDIVRMLQSAISQLHNNRISYQVRMAHSGEVHPDDHGAFVTFVSPSNPPEVSYPGTDVPEFPEAYAPLLDTFLREAISLGVVDLVALRDAAEAVNKRRAEE